MIGKQQARFSRPGQDVRTRKYLFFAVFPLILSLLASCKSVAPVIQKNTANFTINRNPAAQGLYTRIQHIAEKGYAFGHQDATAYGISWKNDGTQYKSDVGDVAGDHPAVHGFEIGHIELGNSHNLDTVPFSLIKTLVKKGHKKGGIITLSWHPDNPVSNKSAWHTRKAVKHILKGGRLHEKYKDWLSRVAQFINALTDESGKPIPLVFRPFHEMNGSWFWWGKGHCSPEEYQRLWRETVSLMYTEFGVSHILYAYSPNTFSDEAEYLSYYPGDAFVDILGVDIYQHWTTANFTKNLQQNISILGHIAKTKDKPYALTEAGLNKVRVADWWTRVLDKHIAHSGIAWALFWRNARPSHHFAPYPEQKSSADFVKFRQLPHVLFLEDIKDIR